MTINEALREGKRLLASPCPGACIDTPALDAALLLAEITRLSREELFVRGNDPLSEGNHEKFLGLVERRRNGECAAYILGRKEFRGLEFLVNRNVLVPRPDTETIVEAALAYIDQMPEDQLSLLDLCTGSGAMAVSLKKERPFLSVTASDISEEALETAAQNAAALLDSPCSGEETQSGKHGGRTVQNARSIHSVRFIHSDLFDKIDGKYNIIVSNPPYVPSGELSALAPEVRLEPALALDGGEGGLELIRKIIPRAGDYLKPRGVLLLEAGSGQMPAISALLEGNGFLDIRIHRDLADRERVISARRH